MFWPFTVNMVIDERMIDALGRWYSMVRMKTKKHGKGIKVFMLGNRYGYMYAFEINCEEFLCNVDEMFKDDKQLTVGAKIVLYFIKTYNIPSGFVLFVDNFFTNYFGVLKALNIWSNSAIGKSGGVHIVGTLRSNAAMIPIAPLKYNEFDELLENHQFQHMINDMNSIVVVMIKSNSKWVPMISTYPYGFDRTFTVQNKMHQPTRKPDPVKRRKKQKKKLKEEKEYDRCIINHMYIEEMHGVDDHNNVCANFTCNRNEQRWTGKAFSGCLDGVVAQTRAIYNHSTAKQIGRKPITKYEVVKELVELGIPALSKLYRDNYIERRRKEKQTENSNVRNEYHPNEIRCIKTYAGIDISSRYSLKNLMIAVLICFISYFLL